MHIVGYLVIAYLAFVVIQGLQQDADNRIHGGLIYEAEQPKPAEPAPGKYDLRHLWVIVPLVLIALVDILESLQ